MTLANWLSALLVIAWRVGPTLSAFRFTIHATRLSALARTVPCEEIEVHQVLVSGLELLLRLSGCSFLRQGDLLPSYGHS